MSNKINFHIKELDYMKKYPEEIYYKGNLSLLKRKKVSIVGTRKPNSYANQLTYKISNGVTYKNKLKYTTTNLNGIR